MIKKYTILVFLLWVSTALFAQEHLTGLNSNPLLSAKNNEAFTLKISSDTAFLPFMDDFSYKTGFYPNGNLWADKHVFINSSYCINPPTVGVATFDALNDTGAVYPYATPTPFLADYLTSLPIKFATTPTPADSIYLSFYYQPQGVADAPNVADSLVLDFYTPATNKWHKVWGTGGLSLDSFQTVYNRYFKQVMIPITQTQYLSNGFKFRFRNYASIAPLTIPSWQSNVDEWNVDYVYLNKQRTKADTLPQDIAFVDPAPGILKTYQQIPARHFNNSNLLPSLQLKESNLSDQLDNVSYEYIVTQENGAFTYTHSGGVIDHHPFLTSGYETYQPHANPAIDFTLPAFGNTDSVVFDITHIMGSNGFTDKNRSNDTIIHRQEFLNSYAYDDGTAENGYGLSGASAKLAYEFTINQADTLGGVEMYFNETLSNPYFKYFYLTIWSSIDPENIIYKSKRLRPEFDSTANINAFHTYQILDTVVLVPGTFYVGWIQTTDDNLNVGFDRNTNAKSHTHYNVDGTWNTSTFDGSLMIRPMMGTSWQNKNSKPAVTGWPAENTFLCHVYPNPTHDGKITIGLPSNYDNEENKKDITTEIFDYLGRKVYSNVFTDKIDVSYLSKGVYYIRFTNYHANEIAKNKLVITR